MESANEQLLAIYENLMNSDVVKNADVSQEAISKFEDILNTLPGKLPIGRLGDSVRLLHKIDPLGFEDYLARANLKHILLVIQGQVPRALGIQNTIAVSYYSGGYTARAIKGARRDIKLGDFTREPYRPKIIQSSAPVDITRGGTLKPWPKLPESSGGKTTILYADKPKWSEPPITSNKDKWSGPPVKDNKAKYNKETRPRPYDKSRGGKPPVTSNKDNKGKGNGKGKPSAPSVQKIPKLPAMNIGDVTILLREEGDNSKENNTALDAAMDTPWDENDIDAAFG